MKKIFAVHNTPNAIHIGLLFVRIAVGVLMLVHGLPKMEMLFSGEPIQFASVFGLSPAISLALAVFAEVLCSVLLIAGLGTRLVVLPLMITMLVAVFQIHAADPFAVKEMAVHFLVTYVALFFTGSGKFSLDYLLFSQTDAKPAVRRSAEDPTLAVFQ
ncbi:MAG TPA: DoxX family protein [Flavisolibacter sp.]|jgi:putative oxidoreductase|nr:DoxX family protein [Flavisolibacter sp.]